MEILQLPIMALQERIEQEMEENPVLELVEDRSGPARGSKARQANPDAPTVDERELVVDETKNNADDFERLLNLDEELPDTFEERSRPSSAADRRRRRPPARRDGQHGGAAASRCRIICTISSAGSIWIDAMRADGRADHLQPRPQRLLARAVWKICSIPTPAPEQLAAGRAGAGGRAAARPAGRRRPRLCASACCCSSRRACRYYEELQDADLRPPGRPRAQPPAADRAQDRLLDRDDSEEAGTSCASSSPSRAPISSASTCPPSRPTCSSSRTTRAATRSGSRTAHADPVHQPVLSPAADESGDRRRRRASTSSGRSTRPSG